MHSILPGRTALEKKGRGGRKKERQEKITEKSLDYDRLEGSSSMGRCGTNTNLTVNTI